MANLIYFTFIASLFINFTFGSMTFFSVNNIFNLIEHGPLEASLILLPNSEDVIDPMFNNFLLEENVNKYPNGFKRVEVNVPNTLENIQTRPISIDDYNALIGNYDPNVLYLIY